MCSNRASIRNLNSLLALYASLGLGLEDSQIKLQYLGSVGLILKR
jgi:hypothetical protein